MFTDHTTRLFRGITRLFHSITVFPPFTSFTGAYLKKPQEQVYNTGRRVQAFLDANDSFFGSINKSDTRSELDTVVTEIGAASGNQAGERVTALGETANQRTLRVALRDNHMRKIAAVARLKLRSVPNFEAFTMPGAHVRVGTLVAHALGMADAAQPYQQVLIGAGLPPDCLAQLTAAAAAVQASIDIRAKSLGKKSNATGLLTELEHRARTVFKTLNHFVAPILAADVGHAGLLAEWNTTRRITVRGPVVGLAPQATAQGTPPVPPTPPVATPPAA